MQNAHRINPQNNRYFQHCWLLVYIQPIIVFDVRLTKLMLQPMGHRPVNQSHKITDFLVINFSFLCLYLWTAFPISFFFQLEHWTYYLQIASLSARKIYHTNFSFEYFSIQCFLLIFCFRCQHDTFHSQCSNWILCVFLFTYPLHRLMNLCDKLYTWLQTLFIVYCEVLAYSYFEFLNDRHRRKKCHL